MPEERRSELLAFLGAIKAEPEEDTPKLALADWFQEQPDPADQARGDFLRQFVRNNQLAKTDPARQEFGALSRLWNTHSEAWAGRLLAAGLKVWATNYMFRWGLLFPALDGAPGAVRYANAVAETEEYAWVGGIQFRALESSEFATFADSRLLDSLIALRIPSTEGNAAFQSLLYASPRIAGLQYLDLAGGHVPVDELAHTPHLAALRHLNLRRCTVTDAAVRSLLSSPHLNSLRSLDVAGNELSIHAARTFADSTSLPALTELNLGPETYLRNHIGPDGTLILVASERTGRLQKLNLASNGIADYGVEAICRQPHMNRLTHLDLSDNLLTDRAAHALATAEHLKSLEELVLQGNAIGPEGALALANSPHLTNVRRIDLSGNRIGKRAATAIRARFGKGENPH